MLPVTCGKRVSKIARFFENLLGNIEIFLCLKSDFPHTKFDFLQRLSAFFNGFLIFLNGFPIFLNGFPLSKKSEKIYLQRQVYKRSQFKLRISRHLLPKLCNRHLLPKLCNCHLLPKLHNCYNAYISPNTLLWCTCVPNSAPNLKSKLKYNLSQI
jgi:hypothetical protein